MQKHSTRTQTPNILASVARKMTHNWKRTTESRSVTLREPIFLATRTNENAPFGVNSHRKKKWSKLARLESCTIGQKNTQKVSHFILKSRQRNTLSTHHIAPHIVSQRYSIRPADTNESARQKMAMVWKMHLCPRSQRHIQHFTVAQCNLRILPHRSRATLTQRAKTKRNRKLNGVCSSEPKCASAHNKEFGTNCTFLRTMISFFENFTSATPTKQQLQQQAAIEIITFYSGTRSRSHAQATQIRVQKARATVRRNEITSEYVHTARRRKTTEFDMNNIRSGIVIIFEIFAPFFSGGDGGQRETKQRKNE